MKQTLSVVIIAKNEAEMLGGCLESVQWADELIVVDGFSSDDTKKIARRFTTKVFSKRFTGFATQKNFAISKAKSDWILILDADERVSFELRSEITNLLINDSDLDAFSIKFRNIFLGKWMRYGGWGNESHVRLFRKGKAKYQTREIHEILLVRGLVGDMLSPIFHFSHRDFSSNLLKTREYAQLQSEFQYKNKAPKITSWVIFRRVIKHFVARFFLQKGYKDGTEGFLESMYQAFSQVFIISSMLWERQRGLSSTEIYRNLDNRLKSKRFKSQSLH